MKWLIRWLRNSDDQEEVEPPRAPAEDPFAEPVELPLTGVLDLHAIPPKQVKAVVTEYLFQARVRGFPYARIIHGKGRGVQRQMVRALLARTVGVRYFYDAPFEAGGWGATVVEFEVDDSQAK